MRICLVNDYSLEQTGGAVISMLEQKRALESAGHKVYIMQLGHPIKLPGVKQTDILFIPPSLTLGASLLDLPILNNSPKNLLRIRQLLESHSIDVVHFQSEFSLAYAVSRIARELDIPRVYTIHTFFWQYPATFALKTTAYAIKSAFAFITKQPLNIEKLSGNPVEQLLKNITLSLAKQCDVVVSPSSHQKSTLEETSLHPSVVLAPNPYQGLKNTPAPRLLESSASLSTLRVVWVGRCAPEKRLFEFLEAVTIAQSALSDDGKTIVVDVVGDGSLLEAAKRKYASDNIRFHGKQPHAKVVTFMDNADVVALTSYHFDNQPMIIAESVCRYRGVVYCDERLTEGLAHAGHRSADKSPAAIADALIELAKQPELRQKLSKGAKKDSDTFSYETYASNLIKVYAALKKPSHDAR